MAKREVRSCDICGADSDTATITPMHLHMDREADAAGGMDNVFEVLDVCPRCAVRLVRIVAQRVVGPDGLVGPVVRDAANTLVGVRE